MLPEPSSWKLVFLGKGLPPVGGCYSRRASLLVQESAFPLTWLPCSRGGARGSPDPGGQLPLLESTVARSSVYTASVNGFSQD